MYNLVNCINTLTNKDFRIMSVESIIPDERELPPIYKRPLPEKQVKSLLKGLSKDLRDKTAQPKKPLKKR